MDGIVLQCPGEAVDRLTRTALLLECDTPVVPDLALLFPGFFSERNGLPPLIPIILEMNNTPHLTINFRIAVSQPLIPGSEPGKRLEQ
jgi:hypothetical protein